MNTNSVNTSIPRHFFFGLLLLVITLAVLIFRPFLTPVVLAAAMSVVFRPIHHWINYYLFRDKPRSTPAALISTVVIGCIVFIPLLLVGLRVYSEVQNIYGYLIDESGRSQFVNLLNDASSKLSRHILGSDQAYTFDSFDITGVVKAGLQWVFANLDNVFRQTSTFFLDLFIMFLALFYFLRDGRELKKQIIALSPLANVEDEKIMSKLEQAIHSIFAGSISIGIIQGIATGIGFTIFGIPNPTLWGTVAAVAALIPGVGTSLVLIPAILYLYFVGQTGMAIGLLIWSVLAIGLIDNFLGPILINRGIQIHPFLILLSVLGGLVFFGPIGFVVGPIVLALLFALLDMYRQTYKSGAPL